MSTSPQVPETRVLAVASHVLHGYVGNTIAAFLMQSLGCEVAALNTVQYSNHVGYGRFKGTRTTASEIEDLFEGLKLNGVDDFDMMLSGYIPGAEAVEAVGVVGRQLKLKANMKPGRFFWILDPVMGDNGKLYVAEEVVPMYKTLIRSADLILPNQYEAEWLSGVKIIDMHTLAEAINVLHSTYRIPHILITSVRFPTVGAEPHLSVIGSTRTSDLKPRIFKLVVPSLDCYFSGTGDMLAALMLVRLREAVSQVDGLSEKESWVSEDSVEATDLPLARAVEMALASMQEILQRTKLARDLELEKLGDDVDEKERHVRTSRASEVRVVRNLDCLRDPQVKYRAEKVDDLE